MKNKFDASEVEPEMQPLTTVNDNAVLDIVELMLAGYIKDYKRAVRLHDVTTQYINLIQCRSDLDHPFYKALFEVIKVNKRQIVREVKDFELLRCL